MPAPAGWRTCYRDSMGLHDELSGDQIRWLIAMHRATRGTEPRHMIPIAETAQATRMNADRISTAIDQLALAALATRGRGDDVALTFDGHALAAQLASNAAADAKVIATASD